MHSHEGNVDERLRTLDRRLEELRQSARTAARAHIQEADQRIRGELIPALAVELYRIRLMRAALKSGDLPPAPANEPPLDYSPNEIVDAIAGLGILAGMLT